MKKYVLIIITLLCLAGLVCFLIFPPYSMVKSFHLWDAIMYDGAIYYPTCERTEFSSFFSGEVEVHLVYKGRIYYKKAERALKYQSDESCEFLYYESGTYKKAE